MKNVGDKIKALNANWSFTGEVAQNFDEHINKSLPLYQDIEKDMINDVLQLELNIF